MRKRLKVAFWLFVLLLLLAGISTYLRFEVPECQYAQANQAASDVAFKCANSVLIAIRSLFNANRTIAAGTVVIAIFTFVLARIARRQVGDTRILQRAYIAVEPQGVIPFESEKHTIVRISIKNVGHLPAKNVRWIVYDEPDGNGKRTEFPIEEENLNGKNVVPPGIVMSYNKNAYIVKDDCAAIKGNAMYFYVWGIVRYNDGFKDNRFTRFCHRYNGNAYYVFPDGKHVGESGLLAEEAKYHQSGNNAD